MTTNEIKDLIASAIAGQGNQVDAGGKLAEILNALADSAGGGGATEPLEITTPEEEVSGTKAEAATALGITEQDFDNILSGKVISIRTTPPGSPSITMIVPLTGVATMDVPDVGTAVIARYNLMSVAGTSNSYIRITRQGDEYTVSLTIESQIIGG